MSETRTTSVPPPPLPGTAKAPSFGMGRDVRGTSRTWVSTAALLLVGATLCVGFGFMVRSILRYQKEANSLIGALHEQMARKDWDGIYRDATDEYRDAITIEKHRALFAGIDRKLGKPISFKQETMNYNGDQAGRNLGATFETRFALDATATERVEWRQGVFGPYRLVAYDISSAELVER